MTKEKGYELLLPCPSAAIQGNIFLVALKRIYPRYIVQYAVVPYNVGVRYFGVEIYGEQDFFLVIGRRRREYFLAEKLAEIRPNRGRNGFILKTD